jgi:hypothetical protein
MVVAPVAEAEWTRSAGTSSKFSCELGERLDLTRTDMTRMIEKQDLIIQRQDVMIEKQEETMNSFSTTSEISASAA